MKIQANLFISNNGKLRVTTRNVGSYMNELAVRLIIDVPDIFFRRPVPIVKLDIPESFLVNPDERVIATWVAQDVAESLKLEVKNVEDGLIKLLEEKSKKELELKKEIGE